MTFPHLRFLIRQKITMTPLVRRTPLVIVFSQDFISERNYSNLSQVKIWSEKYHNSNNFHLRQINSPLVTFSTTYFTKSSRNFASLNDKKPGVLLYSTLIQGLPERIVNLSPDALQPYLRLSRIHRPIGTWLLFLPCTWGLTLGSQGIPDLELIALFGLGAFIMRGAGCTVNDMWDRSIDAKVKRTIDRPLASGQLRRRHAAIWLGLQLSLALSILLSLNAPCFIIGVGSLALVVMYPLAKRVTDWPQAVLGLTFNTGVLMGYTASQYQQLEYLSFPWIDPACLSLYLAGVSWTLVYDTIYAHQDRHDDAALGLGSTALKFGENTKQWIGGFGATTISLLTLAGMSAELAWPYYVGVGTTAAHLLWQIKTLNIHDHKNCSDRFTSNRLIGWFIFFGLAGSYFVSHKPKRTEVKDNGCTIDNESSSSLYETISDSKQLLGH